MTTVLITQCLQRDFVDPGTPVAVAGEKASVRTLPFV